MRVSEAIRYVQGITRGVRRGQMFPPEGRVRAESAPGGSSVTPSRRSFNELGHWEITEHHVPVEGLDRSLRVLQLSDVHLRGREPWVDALADTVSEMRPDLLALTGDIVTRGFTEEAVDRLLGALPPAPLGRWAIMGNWEYWGGAPLDAWRARLDRHGIGLLNNRAVDLGPIQLLGTDDWLAGRPDLAATFANVTPNKPALALTHSPILFDRLARPPVRVVLSGHTHGGQVRVPFAGPFFLPRGSGAYPWGWYERDGVWLFVNRGIGWSVAPLRWRAPPEIAWITLDAPPTV